MEKVLLNELDAKSNDQIREMFSMGAFFFFFKLLLQGGLTFILYLLCHGPIQSISALSRPTKLSLMLLGIFDLWDDDAYEVLLPGTYFGSK